VAQLFSLGGMRFLFRHIVAFCIGGFIGFDFAIYLALGGHDRITLIEAPLFLIAKWTTSDASFIGVFMALHLCFWTLLVGFLFWGVAAFFSWLVRHDN
jgi:hypothetical protein